MPMPVKDRGEPGEVITDDLTVACGDGALETAEGPARRQRRDGSARVAQRLRPAARHKLALMPAIRLTLEYDGSPFVGWQRQDNGPSVQGALEEAIEKLSGERVTVTGAGRTDAGVHALGQVAHFDLEKEFEPGKMRDALNHFLRPDPVAVLECRRLRVRIFMPAFPPPRGTICSASSIAAVRRSLDARRGLACQCRAGCRCHACRGASLGWAA